VIEPPKIKLYRGYCPGSPTLRGPFFNGSGAFQPFTEKDPTSLQMNKPVHACMGDSYQPGAATWYDFGLKPEHGDDVMVVSSIGNVSKIWLDVDGEVFLACHDYTIPLSNIPGVKAIGVCVAEVEFPGVSQPHAPAPPAAVDDKGQPVDLVKWRRQVNASPRVHRAIGKTLERGVPRKPRRALTLDDLRARFVRWARSSLGN
jgi:hypothetical protein